MDMTYPDDYQSRRHDGYEFCLDPKNFVRIIDLWTCSLTCDSHCACLQVSITNRVSCITWLKSRASEFGIFEKAYQISGNTKKTLLSRN